MEKTLKALLYLAIATPFFVFESLFFPYIGSKIFMFEAFTLLAALAWVYLWYKNPSRYSPRSTLLSGAIALFIGVSLLAALNGVNFWRSFWSTFERLDGVFTWVAFFLFSIIVTAVYRKREDWLWLFRAMLGVSVILELRSLYDSMDGNSVIPTHISAVFNSPIYLGVYALFHAGFALYLLYSLNVPLRGLKDLTEFVKSRWSLFYTLGLALNLLVLFLTFSRGPLIGFFVGIGVFTLWYLTQGTKKALFIKFLAVVALLLALTFPFWRQSALLARLATVSQGLGADETRKINWEVALKAFRARPFLGWGSNNYFVAQNEFYNPRLQSIIKESFDRTHNKYLEIAVDAGILGLASYAGMFILIYWQLFAKRKDEPFLTALFAGLLAAYLTQNITAFDNPGSYLPLFFTFGFLSAAFFPPMKKEVRLSPGLAIVFFIILFGFLWQGVFQPYEANVALAYAVGNERHDPRGYQNIFTRYREALSYQTLGDYEIRIQLATFVINAQEISRELLELAVSELEKESQISTRDVFLHIAIAKLYDKVALLEKKPELFVKADETFRQAISLSPNRADSYQHYVIFLLNQGRGKDARNTLRTIKEISPDAYGSDRVGWYLGMSYFVEKNYAEAYKEFQKVLAHTHDYAGGPERLVLARTTFELKKYHEMVHWYEELYRTDTDNPQYSIYLAKAYKQVGDIAGAIAFAKRAAHLSPQAATEADDFLKSLPSSR